MCMHKQYVSFYEMQPFEKRISCVRSARFLMCSTTQKRLSFMDNVNMAKCSSLPLENRASQKKNSAVVIFGRKCD